MEVKHGFAVFFDKGGATISVAHNYEDDGIVRRSIGPAIQCASSYGAIQKEMNNIMDDLRWSYAHFTDEDRMGGDNATGD